MDAIPIMINSKACGTLQFIRQGAYVLCRGQAQYAGEMLRLWVYGKGEPAYLGVVQRSGEVRRKFSSAEFARLPHPLEYCAPEPMKKQAPGPDRLWYDMGDGTLVCHEGEAVYRAFPAEGVRLPRGGRVLLREIEGKQYLIFPG